MPSAARKTEIEPTWRALRGVLDAARAVREFATDPVPAEDVWAALDAARLAPSSFNLQPCEIHWVRDEGVRTRVVRACMNQRAARGAAELVVIVARWDRWRQTSHALVEASDRDPAVSAATRKHRRREAGQLPFLFTVGPFGILSPLRWLLWRAAWLVRPIPDMFCGNGALRLWATQGASHAAQALILAATARGLATCPMGGIDTRRIKRALELRGRCHPCLVVALGHAAAHARIEPRWRRSLRDTVVVHETPRSPS